MTPSEQVRRLLAQYCQFLDDRRLDEWTQLFLSDGLWVLGQQEMRGRKAMRAYMDNLVASRPTWKTTHLCTNMLIELDGTTGRATSDLTMLAKTGEEPWTVSSLGRYHDQVQQASDGTWQFVERRLVVR